MSIELATVLLAASFVALGVWLFIHRYQRRERVMAAEEKAYVHIKWHEVEAMIKKGGPANLRQAVIEGDKLVDHALKHLGVPGESMGERLRAAQTRFSDYDGLWKAHKTRNQVVHETRKELLSFEATQSIGRFRRALQDLGIL